PWEPMAVRVPTGAAEGPRSVPDGPGVAPSAPDNPRSGPDFSSFTDGADSSLRTIEDSTQHTTNNGVTDPPVVEKYGENRSQTVYRLADGAKTGTDLQRRVPSDGSAKPAAGAPEGHGAVTKWSAPQETPKRSQRVTNAEVAARAYQGQSEKQISKAEARAQLKEERRQAAIAEAQGEVMELPAVVDRAGHVLPVTVEQAAAVVRECVRRSGELTVDVEHSGYPVGHRDYALRSVQLGDWQAVAIFHPAAHAATIRELLAEAPRLVAHSATADLIPLAVAGLLGDDADAIERAWERMHDTVIPAKLAD